MDDPFAVDNIFGIDRRTSVLNIDCLLPENTSLSNTTPIFSRVMEGATPLHGALAPWDGPQHSTPPSEYIHQHSQSNTSDEGDDTFQPYSADEELKDSPRPASHDPAQINVDQVEELLIGIDRIRGERNDLHRQLNYLQMESSVEHASLRDQVKRLRDEVAGLEARLSTREAEIDQLNTRHAADQECISNYDLSVQSLSVVIQHLSSSPPPDTVATLGMGTSQRVAAILSRSQDYSSSDARTQVMRLELELEHANQDFTELQKDYDEHRSSCITATQDYHGESVLMSRVEELEGRVMRRNEQIGIHQHDIRRLEWTLKLTEQQLTDLTAELETTNADNDCLMEDCTTARSERDQAREASMQMELQLDRLSKELGSSQERCGALEQELSETRDLIQQLQDQCKGLEEDMASLENRLDFRTSEGSQKADRLADEVQEAKSYAQQLESQLSLCNEALQSNLSEISRLHQLLTKEQSDHLATETESNVEVATLVDLLFRLLSQRRSLKSSAQQTIRDFNKDRQAMASEITQLKASSQSLKALQRQKDAVIIALSWSNQSREQEASSISSQLAESEKTIANLQDRVEQYRGDSTLQIQNLEADLAAASEEAATLLADLNQRSSQVTALEEACNSFRQKLDTEGLRVEELESALGTKAQEQESARMSHLARQAELEEQLGEVDSQLQALQNTSADLRADRDSLARKLDDHQAQLEQLKREADSLRYYEKEAAILKDELEKSRAIASTLEQAARDQELSHVNEVLANERKLSDIQAELQATREEQQQLEKQLSQIQDGYEESELEVKALQAEKISIEKELSQANRNIQALDRRLQESQTLCDELRKELASARVEHSRMSQTWEVKRLELEMTTKRNDQEIAHLKTLAAKYKTQPSHEEKLARLEERNAHLEETLAAKMAESEENDDRLLDVLKEKKKLTAKVDSLQRKIHILQGKLKGDATDSPQAKEFGERVQPRAHVQTEPIARYATPPLTLPELTMPNRRPTTPSNFPVVESQGVIKRTISQEPPRRGREEPATSSAKENAPVPLEGTPSSRKRRVPDEFDERGPVSAEPIIVPVPQLQGGLRRAINGIRSGFTPTRSRSSSPKKGKEAMRFGISDVTNSPRLQATMEPEAPPPVPSVPASTTGTKGRSWLGRKKGDGERAAAGATFKPPSFDRGTLFQ